MGIFDGPGHIWFYLQSKSGPFERSVFERNSSG